MTEARGGTFVWLKGLRGPEPQKWPHDAPTGVRAAGTVLATHKIGAEAYALSFDELERRFPPPAQKEFT